jgi:tetratricopeptide (TPR) repeat protein
MEAQEELVQSRDDLSIERIGLLNQQHRHQEALHLLSSRSFEPWEGGEGLVMEQHVRTYVALARQAIVRGDYTRARRHLYSALESPHNLGEAKHPLANRSNIYFWLGETFERLGTTHDAVQWWNKALSADKDFREMSVQSFSPMSLYRGLSFRRLGRDKEADQLFHDFESYTAELKNTSPKIDYFATSLPNILLFRDNLPRRRDMLVRFLKAQVHLGLGETSEAEAILRQLLEDEPSHGTASDLLEEVQCLAQLASSDIAAGKPQKGRS